MCSRGVFQLQKLSVYFCDFGGSSSGVRDLITSPSISQFLKANPQIQMQAVCKRNHHPYVKGVYANGYIKDVPLKSLNEQQAYKVLEQLRNQMGRKAMKASGYRVYNTKKSIQGKWQANMFNTQLKAQLTPDYKIPEIKQQYVVKQDVQRDVRPRDQVNSYARVRDFRDHHEGF